MSESQAAAIMAAAIMQKTSMPEGSDPVIEATRLYRRCRGIIKRVEESLEKPSSGSAPNALLPNISAGSFSGRTAQSPDQQGDHSTGSRPPFYSPS